MDKQFAPVARQFIRSPFRWKQRFPQALTAFSSMQLLIKDLLKPGDWLIILTALLFCASSFALAWRSGVAEKAVVRQSGHVFAELNLSRDRRIDVPGPLGLTTVAVEKGRARIVSDPGFHQYCVRQGWLERAGEIAICAPNEVSLQIVAREEVYDSLSY